MTRQCKLSNIRKSPRVLFSISLPVRSSRFLVKWDTEMIDILLALAKKEAARLTEGVKSRER